MKTKDEIIKSFEYIKFIYFIDFEIKDNTENILSVFMKTNFLCIGLPQTLDDKFRYCSYEVYIKGNGFLFVFDI